MCLLKKQRKRLTWPLLLLHHFIAGASTSSSYIVYFYSTCNIFLQIYSRAKIVNMLGEEKK